VWDDMNTGCNNVMMAKLVGFNPIRIALCMMLCLFRAMHKIHILYI
jgi:hypothetical protein